MEVLSSIVGEINGVVWGPLMLVIILGTGFILQVGLKFMPIRKVGFGFALLWKGREKASEEGEISPFNALMTSLAATIGTGNIAGVATAIFPGWARRAVLDVVYGPRRHGDQVCRGGLRSPLPRSRRAWQPRRRPDVLHQERTQQKVVLAGAGLRDLRVDRRVRDR